MTTESEPINQLQSEVSKNLELIVKKLCDMKIQLDRCARDPVGQSFLNCWMMTEGTCAHDGHIFLYLVLPFMMWDRKNDPKHSYRAFVNPCYVLGTSTKGLPESIPEDKVASRIDAYATQFGSCDNAYYIRYSSLGIYYAHEGKHRVAFMRKYEQPAIAAWVHDACYPAPERIIIIKPTEEHDEWLALLDERYLQVMWRPEVTRLLLDAYGVKTKQWHDLPELPDEHMVRRIVLSRALHRLKGNAEEERTLDLKEMQEKENTFVERSFFDFDPPLKFLWKPYYLFVVGCLVVGGILTLFDSVQKAGWLLMGGGAGLMCSPSLLRFRITQSVARRLMDDYN